MKALYKEMHGLIDCQEKCIFLPNQVDLTNQHFLNFKQTVTLIQCFFRFWGVKRDQTSNNQLTLR